MQGSLWGIHSIKKPWWGVPVHNGLAWTKVAVNLLERRRERFSWKFKINYPLCRRENRIDPKIFHRRIWRTLYDEPWAAQPRTFQQAVFFQHRICHISRWKWADRNRQLRCNEKKALLSAVLDVLNALANDIDLFRKIETEFATQGAAFEALTVRIEQVKSRIAETSATDGSYTDQTINYLFYGG